MRRYLLLALALLWSLGATAQKTTLNATIDGLATGVDVVVSELSAGRLVPVDTLTPDKKGRVKLERQIADDLVMALSLTQQQSPLIHVILLPNEKVTLQMTYLPADNFIKINKLN